MQFKVPFNSQAEAKTLGASGSKHARIKLKGISLSLPATPELMETTAEGKIQFEGFGSIEDGNRKSDCLNSNCSPGRD